MQEDNLKDQRVEPESPVSATNRDFNFLNIDGEEENITSNVSIRGESEDEDDKADKVNGPQNEAEKKVELKSEKKKKRKKRKEKKMIINLSDTKYDVVRKVAKKMLGWRVTKDPDAKDWDVWWTDSAVQADFLAKMRAYQKTNHFPGMYALARKNNLARNLMRVQKHYPQYYKFFPKTWLLPAERSDFIAQFKERKPKTFILKPEASCQGRGIMLIQHPEQVPEGEQYVAQRYVRKPYLIDGLKIDFRIYLLVAGCNPLRLYLYKEGLARFATKAYTAPTKKNLNSMYTHLTNYSINKFSPKFEFNENLEKCDTGHKRTLTAVMDQLRERGEDVDATWKEIKKMCIKTLCAVQPQLFHQYRSGQPDDYYGHMCFEILGIDILLDHKMKPILLEVNHTPSFGTSTPLDFKVKSELIRDSLTIMNVNAKIKRKLIRAKKKKMEKRVLTGIREKLTKEEKEEKVRKCQAERTKHINANLGGFDIVYPLPEGEEEEEPYEEFMVAASDMYKKSTGADKKKIDVSQLKKNIAFNSKIPESSKKVKDIEKSSKSRLKTPGKSPLKPQLNKKSTKYRNVESKVKTRNFLSKEAGVPGPNTNFIKREKSRRLTHGGSSHKLMTHASPVQPGLVSMDTQGKFRPGQCHYSNKYRAKVSSENQQFRSVDGFEGEVNTGRILGDSQRYNIDRSMKGTRGVSVGNKFIDSTDISSMSSNVYDPRSFNQKFESLKQKPFLQQEKVKNFRIKSSKGKQKMQKKTYPGGQGGIYSDMSRDDSLKYEKMLNARKDTENSTNYRESLKEINEIMSRIKLKNGGKRLMKGDQIASLKDDEKIRRAIMRNIGKFAVNMTPIENEKFLTLSKIGRKREPNLHREKKKTLMKYPIHAKKLELNLGPGTMNYHRGMSVPIDKFNRRKY